MVSVLVVEVPAASTKRSTQRSQRSQRNWIWIQPLFVSGLYKSLRDLCDLRVRNFFFIGSRMVSVVGVVMCQTRIRKLVRPIGGSSSREDRRRDKLRKHRRSPGFNRRYKHIPIAKCRPAPDDQIRIISIRLSGIGQDLSDARRSTLSEPPPKRDHVPFLFGSTGIFESRA
jgi:hypothetical protein